MKKWISNGSVVALATALSLTAVAAVPAQATAGNGKASGKLRIHAPAGETDLCAFIHVTSITLSADGGATSTTAVVTNKSASNVINAGTNTWPVKKGVDAKKAYCDVSWSASGMAKGKYTITYNISCDMNGLCDPALWFAAGKLNTGYSKKSNTNKSWYPTHLKRLASASQFNVVSNDSGSTPGTMVLTSGSAVKVKKSGNTSVKQVSILLDPVAIN